MPERGEGHSATGMADPVREDADPVGPFTVPEAPKELVDLVPKLSVTRAEHDVASLIPPYAIAQRRVSEGLRGWRILRSGHKQGNRHHKQEQPTTDHTIASENRWRRECVGNMTGER